MHASLTHIRYLLIAIVALALSAGLAFGATPPAAEPGLANAAAHAGKTVPVANGLEDLGEDEEVDEDVDEEEDVDQEEDVEEDVEAEDDASGGENCATDPSALTEEELSAMKHGSIVCWAAHQAEWPEWFSNHGAFVRCWAHQGKADATSCTEDPNAEPATPEDDTALEDTDTAKAGNGKGHGKGGNGKAKGHSKHAR